MTPRIFSIKYWLFERDPYNGMLLFTTSTAVDGTEIRRSPVDIFPIIYIDYIDGFIHSRWVFARFSPSTVFQQKSLEEWCPAVKLPLVRKPTLMLVLNKKMLSLHCNIGPPI